MKRKLRLNPNTILILVILAVAVLMNVVTSLIDSSSTGVVSVDAQRDAVLSLAVLNAVKMIIIVIMGWLVFRIIRRVVRKEEWNDGYYQAIKRIGWLSVLAVLLDAISSVIDQDYIDENKDISGIATDATIYGNIISYAVFSYPVAWFLIALVFISADVLRYVREKET